MGCCDCATSVHWNELRKLLTDIAVASHQFKTQGNTTTQNKSQQKEQEEEDFVLDLEGWYAFADDAGIASEYLPLVVFLPLEQQDECVRLNDLCDYSRASCNRLKPGIDWV